MRLARPDITLEERSLVNLFASWLLDIGDGKTGCPAEEDLENTSWIDIPAIYCLTPDEQADKPKDNTLTGSVPSQDVALR
ncbi:hypothetical protein Tco_1500449 [Tanacetum coccineum]